jgi:uncharacterized protein with HEPN domain
MPPERSDAAWLWDMLDAGRAIVEFVAGKSFVDYTADQMLRGAVERHIEIIGEAARNVSREFQAANPDIPWQKIVAQRHVLPH